MDKLTIGHYQSPRPSCLPCRPKSPVEWEGDENHHPCIFQVLLVALIPALPVGLWGCFCWTTFPSTVTVASMTTLSPGVREPVGWGMLSVAEEGCSNFASWNWWNKHEMGSGTPCEVDTSENAISHLAAISPYSHRWSRWQLESPGIDISSEPVSNNTLKSLISSLSQGHSYLG